MISILLADDQALVRAGFRALLDAQPDIEVVGEAADGEEAVQLATTLLPDVVLMDIRMPAVDGLAATARITADPRLDKVRIVILWASQEAASPRIILVTNRVRWEVTRVVGVYRHRWTGTETFHRDGKQQLGMGDCQLRSREGQSRHMYLVMLAYSRLMSQLKQGHAYEWAYRKLTTIGEACRAILNETLRTTLDWALERVQRYDWDRDRVVASLGLAGDG